MDSTFVPHDSVSQYIKGWWLDLCNIIGEIVSSGKEPILVTLSRKMPRFVQWILDTRIGGLLAPADISAVKNVEITTELALPFIFFETETDNKKFIILDDIIIHGSTLKNVANDLLLLTGEKPHISCIFRLESASCPDSVRKSEFDKITEISQLLADDYIDFISEIVERTQLPIDMEFPIFEIPLNIHTEKDSFYKIAFFSERNFENVYWIGEEENRFTVDIPTDRTSGKNNEFSKIRFFKSPEKILAEAISPHVLSDVELTSLDSRLFISTDYQNLWDNTTHKIRLLFSEAKTYGRESAWMNLFQNFTRSLCVWANYLYSLSCFIANRIDTVPLSMPDPTLSKKDLSYILGERLTVYIYPRLLGLIKSAETTFTFKDRVSDVPDNFAPSAFKSELEYVRIASAIVSDSAEEVLEDIFKFQHYNNKKFSNPLLSIERLYFGETYKSLLYTVTTFFDAVNLLVLINVWIDKSIDSGYVIPKYEKIKSGSGSYYWRRFFHSGIRKFQ